MNPGHVPVETAREEAATLLARASADARWLEARHPDGGLLDLEGYGFKTQQAVEKAIKSVLWVALRQSPPREHDLMRIKRLLPANLPALPLTDGQLDVLYPFAVAFRYEPIAEDEMAFLPHIEEMKAMTDAVIAWAKNIVDPIS